MKSFSEISSFDTKNQLKWFSEHSELLKTHDLLQKTSLFRKTKLICSIDLTVFFPILP